MQMRQCRMAITTAFTSAALLVKPAPALADSFDKGERAVQRGDFSEAVRLFSKSAKPEAAFRMGEMAEKGKVTGCNLNCALQWYIRSADAGYLNALPSVAVLYWNDGQREKALYVLKVGARWNEPASRDFLKVNGYAVPDPDLWNAHIAKLRAEQAVRQQQQDPVGNILGSFFSGYYGGTTAPLAQSPSVEGAPLVPQVAAPSVPQPQASTRICPNGGYIYGTECRLAPSGQYLPGPATLAPNGQYVTGRPQMAPDGTYVGGNGPVRMCPDGSYVSGSRCILTPNGSYVGAP